LEVLNERIKESSSQFFDNKQCPNKSVDLRIYEEIKKGEMDEIIEIENLRYLFNWMKIISLYSEE